MITRRTLHRRLHRQRRGSSSALDWRTRPGVRAAAAAAAGADWPTDEPRAPALAVGLRPAAGRAQPTRPTRSRRDPRALAPWTYADAQADRRLATGRRRVPRPGHRVLVPRGLQRRRHRPGGRRLHPALGGAPGAESSRDRRAGAAPDADLPPGRHRARMPATSCCGCRPTARSTPAPSRAELPDPSDSDESYWLARTVWALGEGYAAFADRRPCGSPTSCATGCSWPSGRARARRPWRATAPGWWRTTSGCPAWLITGGADATAEACLGLAAYVPASARRSRERGRRWPALRRGRRGDAQSDGDGVWPFGAVLPWTRFAELVARLGWRGRRRPCAGRPRVLGAASTARGRRSPMPGRSRRQLLTSGGPYNAWSPGARARPRSPTAPEGRVSGPAGRRRPDRVRPASLHLAGLAGGWFFGANPSGAPTYDPATGATFDGVEFDGRVNRNSGAESTIHGLLAMLALDAHPAGGSPGGVHHRVRTAMGCTVLEAESGALSGGAAVVTPPSTWTGAANWSGGAYVAVPRGRVGPARRRRATTARSSTPSSTGGPGSHGTSTYTAVDTRGRRTVLGQLENGGLGTTGVVQADGLLKPFALSRGLPAGAVSVVVETTGDLQLDALMLQPLVSSVAYARGSGAPAVLYANSSTSPTSASPQAPGAGWAWTPEGDRRNPVGLQRCSPAERRVRDHHVRPRGGRYAPSVPDVACRSGPNAYRHAFARMGCPLGYSKSCSPSRTNPSRSHSALLGPLVTFG